MSKFFGDNPKPAKGLKKFLASKRDAHEIIERPNPGAGLPFNKDTKRLLKPPPPFIKDKSNVVKDEAATDASPKKASFGKK